MEFKTKNIVQFGLENERKMSQQHKKNTLSSMFIRNNDIFEKENNNFNSRNVNGIVLPEIITPLFKKINSNNNIKYLNNFYSKANTGKESVNTHLVKNNSIVSNNEPLNLISCNISNSKGKINTSNNSNFLKPSKERPDKPVKCSLNLNVNKLVIPE